MVSVGIFAFMTAFLVAKYGTFNQGILLTNLAYDVALTLRNAQSYGLNVKSQPVAKGANYSDKFDYAYGVHFDKSTAADLNKTMIFFVDINSNGIYDAVNDEKITTYNIKRGSYVSLLCVAQIASDCSSVDSLDITFKRPDPNAIIKGTAPSIVFGSQTYAEITLRSTDGGERKVAVRSTGQITVCNNNNVCN